MPSGKEVLLHFLKKYSLKKQEKEDLEEASENIRVGFLLHGSTPDEMWYNVDAIEWGEALDEKEEVYSQGLHLKNKDISLTELFEYITWGSDNSMPKEVKARFPNLTQSEYYSATRIIALLLSSLEWSSHLSQVENEGKLDFEQVEKYLTSYKKKMNLFRQHPEKYLGYEEEE